jgi:predicted nuclease of predicted toxin-antitoxin system
MKFLADECCDAALVRALRADGHNVLYVMESMRGATDEEILSRAFAEDRIVLTEDSVASEGRLEALFCCGFTFGTVPGKSLVCDG